MTDQATLTSQPLILRCPIHSNVDWQGDVFCKHCNKIYICSEVTEDEYGKKKHVYPDADPKGMCSCDKRLFGGTDFTARPMCHECAMIVLSRKAAQEGKVLWVKDDRAGMDGQDYANPMGDRSYDLGVFANGDHFVWEVSFPEGHCGGTSKTREEARAFAERIYNAVKPYEPPKRV